MRNLAKQTQSVQDSYGGLEPMKKSTVLSSLMNDYEKNLNRFDELLYLLSSKIEALEHTLVSPTPFKGEVESDTERSYSNMEYCNINFARSNETLTYLVERLNNLI